MIKELTEEIRSKTDSAKAEHLVRFFKTGKGQYGEGDRFLGLTVPLIRSTAKKYYELTDGEVMELLRSQWHEERLCALIIMQKHFSSAGAKERGKIVSDYLANTPWINNWDLVDLSCPGITGEWFLDRDRTPLIKLAGSALIWDRRIAMVSCYSFIKRGDNLTAFTIAEKLLRDKEDLIHKAVGWMLRETGKRCSESELLRFIGKNYSMMPRTALRYAIEKFPTEKRRAILNGIF